MNVNSTSSYVNKEEVDAMLIALKKDGLIKLVLEKSLKLFLTSTNTDDKGKYTDEIKVLTSSSSEGLAMTGLVAGASLASQCWSYTG